MDSLDDFFTKLEPYDPQTYVIKFIKYASGYTTYVKWRENKKKEEQERLLAEQDQSSENRQNQYLTKKQRERVKMQQKIETLSKETDQEYENDKAALKAYSFYDYAKNKSKLNPEVQKEIDDAKQLTWQQLHELHIKEMEEQRKVIKQYEEKGEPWYNFLKIWKYFYQDEDEVNFTNLVKQTEKDAPRHFLLSRERKKQEEQYYKDNNIEPKRVRVMFQETWDEFDPVYYTYARTGFSSFDKFYEDLEDYQMYYHTYTWFNWTYMLMLPLLFGFVGARQIPKFAGQSISKSMLSKIQYKGGFQSEMTRREASLILNVKQNATPDEIRNRHRKLMITNHPDNKGSAYIASKINQAKELLLGENS